MSLGNVMLVHKVSSLLIFTQKRIMPQEEERCQCSVWTTCRNSWLTRLASIFYRPSSLVTISEDLYSCRMAIIISRDVRNTHPTCNIPIVPDCSCLDKHGMVNSYRAKVTVFNIHIQLRATCEMVKYFHSLIHGDATC